MVSLPTEPQGSPRILECIAYSFSSGSSRPRNWNGFSFIAGGFFTNWPKREDLNQSVNQSWGLDNCFIATVLLIYTSRVTLLILPPPYKSCAQPEWIWPFFFFFLPFPYSALCNRSFNPLFPRQPYNLLLEGLDNARSESKWSKKLRTLVNPQYLLICTELSPASLSSVVSALSGYVHVFVRITLLPGLG